MVGANLGRALLCAGNDVHAIIRARSSRWRIADMADDFVLHVGDLRDGDAVRRAVVEAKPEIIFHLATTRESASRDERLATMRTNVEGLQHLIEASAPLDYESFVVAGSSLVYGKRNYPLSENAPLGPSGFYAATRAAGTILAEQFGRSTGKPLSILRLFSVYGPWESGSRLIPTAILAALDDRPLRLTAPGFRRDLVFVDDVVDAFSRAATATSLEPGELINIGTGAQTANEETVSIIERACGKKIRLSPEEYPPRETDTDNWVADPSKATAALGWKPRHSVEEGIAKTVDWMIGNRDAYSSVSLALATQ